MRDTLKTLVDTIKGTTVFIVGGGASLKNFDYSRLEGHNVIGINQACKYIPSLTAIYWADEDWAARNDYTLESHRCKLRFCARKNLPVGFDANNQIRTVGGATPLYLSGDTGFDSNINNVRGNNSGCHTINLAINAGANTIVLLGFDMSVGHWHNDYELSYNTEVYESFRRSIDSMVENIPDKVNIVNCSPISTITSIPKGSVDDYL